MNAARTRSIAARLFAAGLLLWASTALAGPGPMQVEEPGLGRSNPPIEPEKDQAAWKERKSASLTPEQKAALKNRQQTMRDMMLLIQQKRRALREARPEDRQALARELHNLILEKAQVADIGRVREHRKGDAGKGEADGSSSSVEQSARLREGTPTGNADKKIRQHEQLEEAQRQQEQRRRAQEERLRQQESRNNGNNK